MVEILNRQQLKLKNITVYILLSFKNSARQQTYKQTKENWTERVSASDHPNTKWNFKIGYYRETGIVSTQMQANKQIQNGFETENNSEMKQTRDKYRKRNQSSINVRGI